MAAQKTHHISHTHDAAVFAVDLSAFIWCKYLLPAPITMIKYEIR